MLSRGTSTEHIGLSLEHMGFLSLVRQRKSDAHIVVRVRLSSLMLKAMMTSPLTDGLVLSDKSTLLIKISLTAFTYQLNNIYIIDNKILYLPIMQIIG